ncbi:GntR family transcriptional regulator [Pseudofrankia sp. BMG5.37]|uniref:GntR family transcriptional regulator n=1 Tax=Pseudofrankia sp. BMG5.37 TaxID=3050035 RepID=UPI00289620C0|nr:GntR family transcriptional regulator [Pseudofrankia sp. BMG5.37]MDT3442215.1 GntR family transcriptional regulator [Pseudofrankia sp. BMG5.37]
MQDLVQAVRNRIISGELEPGRRLAEEWLGAEFGVSRIPVREAIRELAAEGFVRSERYGGTFVAKLDSQAAHDLLDARAALEPLAAAQAAIRCSPENLALLKQILDEAEGASQEGRYDDARRFKGRFAEQLAVASGNETLIALMRTVRWKIEWATSIDAIAKSAEDKRQERRKTLHEIVDAIAARDPSRATAAVLANIDGAYVAFGWRRVVDTRYREPSTPTRRN